MTADFGIFAVTLDFELYWGVRDRRTVQRYGRNLSGVRDAVRQLLELFQEYGIHATWATTGFIFFENAEQARANSPSLQPTYSRAELSPYQYLADSKPIEPAFHFAPELVELIRQYGGQEIGTHTFSHYYCLEDGQTLEQFREDILAAIRTAESRGIRLKSLAFPRNQWSRDCLGVLSECGIACFRGNENGWQYRAANGEYRSIVRRGLRLLDSYVNVSGQHTYSLSSLTEKPYNLRSSRYLRPYSRKLAFLDPLRLRRIVKAMEDAAANQRVFHMWWHPHNFGANTGENLAFLRRILERFRHLRERYGMKSLNMGEICELLEDGSE